MNERKEGMGVWSTEGKWACFLQAVCACCSLQRFRTGNDKNDEKIGSNKEFEVEKTLLRSAEGEEATGEAEEKSNKQHP